MQITDADKRNRLQSQTACAPEALGRIPESTLRRFTFACEEVHEGLNGPNEEGFGEEWLGEGSVADLAGGSGRCYWLQRRPRAAQERFQLCFFGSQSLQERSKRLPRGFLGASASKMRFRSHLGPILGSKKRARDVNNH